MMTESKQNVSLDWRGLCEDLADALAVHHPGHVGDDELVNRAREALAQPEPEVVGPTDEELLALVPQGSESDFYLPQGLPSDWIDGDFIAPPEAVLAFARAVLARWGRAGLADGPAVPEGREPASVACEPSDGDLLQLMPEQFRADLGTVSRMAAHGAGPDIKPGLFRVSLNTGALEYARAVLARYGHQPTPPAEGEVAEFITQLKSYAEYGTPIRLIPFVITRAADLLEQRHPAPVPVSERLPGPEDCDEKGRCWWLHVGEDGVGDWFQRAPYPSATSYAFFRMTHWLPANALPLPSNTESGDCNG